MSVIVRSQRTRRASARSSDDKDVQDVHERLVSAAAEVFADSGYHASRISDIVRRAGVAQGTFYLYFQNKEAVFLELVNRFCTRILDETLGTQDPLRAGTLQDVIAQVRQMWRTLIVRCREQPNLVRAILREPRAVSPTVGDTVRGYHELVANGLAGYVTVAAERGLVRLIEPQLAGWLVQGLVERAMYYAIDIDPGADAEWLADQLMTIEGGGLLVRWDDAWLAGGATGAGSQ